MIQQRVNHDRSEYCSWNKIDILSGTVKLVIRNETLSIVDSVLATVLVLLEVLVLLVAAVQAVGEDHEQHEDRHGYIDHVGHDDLKQQRKAGEHDPAVKGATR